MQPDAIEHDPVGVIWEVVESLRAIVDLAHFGDPNVDQKDCVEYRMGSLLKILQEQLTEVWCCVAERLNDCPCGQAIDLRGEEDTPA
jgi:hypothetical protein